MMFNQNARQHASRSVVDQAKLHDMIEAFLKASNDKTMATIIKMYYNILDQSLRSEIEETGKGWVLAPGLIDPKINMNRSTGNIAIGSEIHVMFMSEYQNSPVEIICIENWNFFTEQDPVMATPRVCHDIRTLIVPDPHLGDLRAIMIKYFERVFERLKIIWIGQVLGSLVTRQDDENAMTQSTGMDGDQLPAQQDIPAKQPARQAPTARKSLESIAASQLIVNQVTADNMLGGLPYPQISRARKKTSIDNDVIPFESKSIHGNSMALQKPNTLPAKSDGNVDMKKDGPALLFGNREEDDDDDDTTIDFSLASRVPFYTGSTDDDDDVPSFTPDMLKK